MTKTSTLLIVLLLPFATVGQTKKEKRLGPKANDPGPACEYGLAPGVP